MDNKSRLGGDACVKVDCSVEVLVVCAVSVNYVYFCAVELMSHSNYAVVCCRVLARICLREVLHHCVICVDIRFKDAHSLLF